MKIALKREDCNSGLAYGGNKVGVNLFIHRKGLRQVVQVRKLEYLVADALAKGADTLVSIGGIQSKYVERPVPTTSTIYKHQSH